MTFIRCLINLQYLVLILGIYAIAPGVFAIPTITEESGLSWTIKPPESLPIYVKERIYESFGKIKSHEELSQLIQEIARSTPMTRIEVTVNNNDQLTIEVEPAKPIGSVEVDSTSHTMETKLSGHLQKFVGLVPAKEILASMRGESQKILNDYGYFLAKMVIKITESNRWTTIHVKVEEDYPCRIRQIMLGFQLPEGLKFAVSPGDICDKSKITDAVDTLSQELTELGYNQKRILEPELEVDPQSNTALLIVPGMIGQKITYFIDTSLQNLLGDELDQLDISHADPESMRAEIIRNYLTAGYNDVVVEPATKVILGRDSIQYRYKVAPGTKYVINDISFQGSYYFSSEELTDTLELESVFAIPLNHESIQKGVENLLSLYQQSGFWEAEIPYPRITKDSNTGLTKLVFIITEGKQRTFTDLIVKGNSIFPASTFQELLPLEFDQAIPFTTLTNYEEDIEDLYKSRGYVYADAKIDLLQNNDYRAIKTRVMVTINEGIRVKFGQIAISGLINTKEEVVKREIRFSVGQWYDPELVEETRLALVKLGIFASVGVAIDDTSAMAERRESLPFSIIVREGKPGSVAFGPGWSYEDGARYVIESSYSNLGGTGRKVFAKGKISAEKNQDRIANKTLVGRFMSIGYVEPYMLDLPITGIASMSHKASAIQRVWQFTNAGEVSLNHNFIYGLLDSKVAGFYGIKQTRLETTDIEQNALIYVGDTRIGELGLRYEIDDRDDIAWTTSGYRLNSEVAWAGYSSGGDVAYSRWSAKATGFYELIEAWTVAVHASFSAFGTIARRGSETYDVLPNSERLFAGGSDTNRGFRSRELGPYFAYWDYQKGELVDRQTAGGDARSIYKFELRHRFDSKTLGVAAFLDASNVFFTPDQVRHFNRGFLEQGAEFPEPKEGEPTPVASTLNDNLPYHFERVLSDPWVIFDYHYVSYGLALSIFTPIGPIDLSYGIPYRRCPPALRQCKFPRGAEGDTKLQSGAFHVNIGSNF